VSQEEKDENPKSQEGKKTEKHERASNIRIGTKLCHKGNQNENKGKGGRPIRESNGAIEGEKSIKGPQGKELPAHPEGEVVQEGTRKFGTGATEQTLKNEGTLSRRPSKSSQNKGPSGGN